MKFASLLILALVFISACSNPFEDKDQCPCNVKVRELQEDGSYTRNSVTLKTLNNPRSLSSGIIQISLNPKFYDDGTTTEITPEAQYFIDSDNNIIPTSTVSDELFSIYKIMEDLYFFDQSIGVDKILTYPRRVSLVEKNKKPDEKENAFYAPQFDRIGVLSYDGKKAPLGHNSGVIAHEHFHAIFNKIISPIENTVNDNKFRAMHSLHDDGTGLFTKNDSPDEELIVHASVGYNYLVLKSLDEGLADFWANLHTNMSNSYLASYSPEDQMDTRSVEASVRSLDVLEFMKKDLNFEAFKAEERLKVRPVRGAIYANAVKYSNILKTISQKMFPQEMENRETAIGLWIVDSLKRLAITVEAKGRVELLTQAVLLESFVPANKQSLGEICKDLNSFLVNHSKVPSCSSF